jgi:hypothetical protein
MGLYNNKLSRCPFTGVEVNSAGDPSPALDGISYYGQFNGRRFPIKLHYADAWAQDTWLNENGSRFIEHLATDDKLDTYFQNGRTLAEVKRDYVV